MKLLFQIPGNEIGGNETVLWNLFEYLSESEHRVWLVSPPGPARNFLEAHVEGCVSPAEDRLGWSALLRDIDPDVVIATLGNICGLGAAARLRKIPCLWWASLAACHLAKDNPALQITFTIFDEVIAPSRFAAKELHAPDWVRLHQMPYGIDTRRFRPFAKTEGRPLRASLGVPPDAFLVGYAARYDVKKRHGDVVEGFAELLAERPDAHLLLLGRTEGKYGAREWNEVQRIVQNHGIGESVHFVSAFPEAMPEWLATLDLFCFPALEEGFGLALLEAMAVGLPVVVADSGGAGELVAGTGCERIFPAKDSLSLGRHLRELQRDPAMRERMGRRSRELARSRYSVAQMADGLIGVCEAMGEKQIL